MAGEPTRDYSTTTPLSAGIKTHLYVVSSRSGRSDPVPVDRLDVAQLEILLYPHGASPDIGQRVEADFLKCRTSISGRKLDEKRKERSGASGAAIKRVAALVSTRNKP
jgi:hypothetical protein